MKSRCYQGISGIRWLGFILAMAGVYILSGANTEVQWIGWSISCMSCSIWLYAGIKDQDIPRALMEFAYLCLALRGVYNWIQISG